VWELEALRPEALIEDGRREKYAINKYIVIIVIIKDSY
jgi:hypothetical protein